jgi:hypothetical protein
MNKPTIAQSLAVICKDMHSNSFFTMLNSVEFTCDTSNETDNGSTLTFSDSSVLNLTNQNDADWDGEEGPMIYTVVEETKKKQVKRKHYSDTKKYLLEPRNEDGSLNTKLMGSVQEVMDIEDGVTLDTIFNRYFSYHTDAESASQEDVTKWLKGLGFEMRLITWR